jgi:uncharacterized protein HemY
MNTLEVFKTMSLFSEGIASHYFLLQLTRQLETNGILTAAQTEEVLQKAIEHAVQEISEENRNNSHSKELGDLDKEMVDLEIASVERAIEILRRDLNILREARNKT